MVILVGKDQPIRNRAGQDAWQGIVG